MCLLTVRNHDSYQPPPDLGLKRGKAAVLRQSAEVALNAECCLALVKGLRPREDFSIAEDQPAFAVLQEHYRDFYRSIQAWIQFIFEPTADHLAPLEGSASARSSQLSSKLESGIEELQRRLDEVHAEYHWDDVQPLDRTEMPARSPWVCIHTLHSQPREKPSFP